MKIYDKTGKEILSIEVNDESVRYRAVCDPGNVTLYYSLTEFVEIPLYSYIIYDGERYTLWAASNFTKEGSRSYNYTVIFGGYGEFLKLVRYKNLAMPVEDLRFSLWADPRMFLTLLVDCLNEADPDKGWSLGKVLESVRKNISFNHVSCYDALKRFADDFKTEFEFEVKKIHFGKVERFKDNPLALSYGKGKGFLPGTGRTGKGEPPLKRLRVQGGAENIIALEYGSRTLLLPKNQMLEYKGRHYQTDANGTYIMRADKPTEAFPESSFDASFISPSRAGVISEVITIDAEKNLYQFKDSSIPESLNFEDYIIEGEEMEVIFQAGGLTGRSFAVKYHHDTRLFEIQPREHDGFMMPSESLKPVVGGEYAVFNVYLPEAYICDNATKTGASWDMFREAVRFFYDNEEEEYSFTGELDGLLFKKKWEEIGYRIKPGGYVLFSDDEFQKEGVLIRQMSVKDYINDPHSPTIELSNAPVSTSVSTELEKIDSNEVVSEERYREALVFAQRRFRDALETIELLKGALSNFTDSIMPIAVQTMSLLVGDESLQFRFVNSKTNPVQVPHIITYNAELKELQVPAGIIQHMTLGVKSISSSHKASEYRFWELSGYSLAGIPDKEARYLYAKVQKNDSYGEFILSKTAIKMEDVDGVYHLLVGILNSEYEGSRSFVELYGFTEVLPGRITTDRVVSADGLNFIDFVNNSFRVGSNSSYLDYNSDGKGIVRLKGTLVQSDSGIESPIGCFRGVFNGNNTYFWGDEVTFETPAGTSTYRYINKTPSRGIKPPNTDYWMIVAEGAEGAKGSNGDWTKILFRWSQYKPSVPVGNSSVWWSESPDKEKIAFSHGTSWVKKGGLFRSPEIGHGQITKNRVSFTTRSDNEMAVIELSVSSELNYDFALVGLLDNANLSRDSNYFRRISGIATELVYMNIPKAGAHFLEVGYAKDGSGTQNEDFATYRMVDIKNCWMTAGTVDGETGDVRSWSDPVQFITDSGDTERIYLLSDKNETPKMPYSDPYVDDYVPLFNYTDYNPKEAYKAGQIVRFNGLFFECVIANTGYSPVDADRWQPVRNWTDNPSGVSAALPYEFESTRKKSNGVWGEFSTPVLWMKHTSNGDFYEYRFAVNGSRSQPPAITNIREPLGWSTAMPKVGDLEYLWMTTAKISGDTNELLQNWGTPVRITPVDGKEGSPGAVVVYCGLYDPAQKYFGNSRRVDAVKYNNTYFVARMDAGVFQGIAPTDVSKWNDFGSDFESVATKLLLAENASIGMWWHSQGSIVSTVDPNNKNRILLQVGYYSGTVFVYDPKIVIESDTSGGDYSLNRGQGSIIKLSASDGTVETRAKNTSSVSYMSPSGIFANSAETNALPLSSGYSHRAAIVGIGRASVPASSWGQNSEQTMIAGVYGRALNTGTAPAYGGYFQDLKACGMIYNTRYIGDNSSVSDCSLTSDITSVVGVTNSGVVKTIYLPNDGVEGRIVLVTQMGGGHLRVDTRSGQSLFDDHTENDYFDIKLGNTGLFVFGKWIRDGFSREIWMFRRLSF